MPRRPEPPDALFRASKAREVPFAFVLDELEPLGPTVGPMFGATAVWLDEKFILMLREKGDADDGVWLATERAHHDSLRAQLPSLRSIALFGAETSKWQLLPADADDFEESVLLACKLVRARDPRIGVVPARKKPRAAKKPAAKAAKKKPRR